MSSKNGKLFIFIGPSGVGKGTILASIKERNPEWIFPVSCTTRDKRPGEIDKIDYNFFTKDIFEKKIEQGDFLEWACVHGKNYYGLLKESIFTPLKEGKKVFREIDIQGFEAIRDQLDKKELVSIFLLPPGIDLLIKRIRERSPLTDEEVKRRMESAKNEIAKAEECDYQIQTHDGEIDRAVEEIEEIVKSESEK